MAGIDLTGQRFGRLVVLEVCGLSKNRQRIWKCQCDCGNITQTRSDGLRSGASQSCGCLHSEIMREMKTVHGMHNAPEYKVWSDMKIRCSNESHPSYPDYGGRGIQVHPEWKESFVNFYKDVGPRPSDNHSIEREDVNGNYEPNNVKWATAKEQAQNRRNNHIVTYKGQNYVLAELARQNGLDFATLYRHLQSGKTPEEAVEHLAAKKNR